jgi:hypothetical protein
VPLGTLTEPFISDRSKFPAKHLIVDGLSPWRLQVAEEMRTSVVALRWSVIGYDRSRPVGDGSVIATETATTVEVVAVGRDGNMTILGSRECTLRTELDDRSLADRQVSGQGWLLPIGYTVVVDTALG